MDDGSFTWKTINQIDIRQYPQLNPSPLFLYDTITTLSWCPGQPIVALGLKYQGIMVWTVEGSMLYSYNGYIPAVCNNPRTKEESPMSTIEETEIEIAGSELLLLQHDGNVPAVQHPVRSDHPQRQPPLLP